MVLTPPPQDRKKRRLLGEQDPPSNASSLVCSQGRTRVGLGDHFEVLDHTVVSNTDVNVAPVEYE